MHPSVVDPSPASRPSLLRELDAVIASLDRVAQSGRNPGFPERLELALRGLAGEVAAAMHDATDGALERALRTATAHLREARRVKGLEGGGAPATSGR